MKWLTLEWIKKHSRIDFNDEDDLLELYGEAAEEAVLNICNRSYTDIVGTYGEVPKPLFVAALMLVEESYTQRSAVSPQNMYDVQGFDTMIKPYMKLTTNNRYGNNTSRNCHLQD